MANPYALREDHSQGNLELPDTPPRGTPVSMNTSADGSPMAFDQHRSISSYTDIKRWFVAIIKPNFHTAEAQQADGRMESPRMSRLALSPQQMDSLRTVATSLNREDPFESERKCCCCRWFAPLGPGSVRSCSSTLAATALGSGALALPYAFSLTGVGVGLITMTLALLVSSMSLQVLMVAGRYTNCKSYASLMALVGNSKLLSFLLDFCIVLNGIGAITCILIFEGDFLPSVFLAPPGLQPGQEGLVVGRRICVAGVAAVVYPWTLLPNISALRYTSVLVPVVLIATIVIVWCEVPSYSKNLIEQQEVVIWKFDFKTWLQAIPLMVNAFTNHQNAIPAGNQMEQPSVARIVKATVNANLMVFGLLTSLGLGGYLTWGSLTEGNFIKNYPHDNNAIWLCRVMLAITVYFVIPVALMPASKSCAQLVLSASSPGEGERPVGRCMHIFSSTLCLGICTSIAVATDNIASVIGVLGGLLATSVMFWFPAVIYRVCLWPTQPPVMRYFVLSAIIFFGVCGFASVVMMFVK